MEEEGEGRRSKRRRKKEEGEEEDGEEEKSLSRMVGPGFMNGFVENIFQLQTK